MPRQQKIIIGSCSESDNDDEPAPRKRKRTKQARRNSQASQDPNLASQDPNFASQDPDFSSQAATDAGDLSFVLPQLGTQLTNYEKELIVDTVLRRICSKYFLSQRSFKKTAMFFPKDKIKAKHQDELILLIKQRLMEATKLHLVTDGSKFIISIPKDVRPDLEPYIENYTQANDSRMSNDFSSQLTQTLDNFNHGLLTIVLSLIYFYQGKISEEELVKQRLPGVLPFITSFYSPGKDLSKTLQDFEHRAFIEKTMTKGFGDNPPKVFVHWGLRAKTEVDKKTLIPVFCKFGNCTPENLPKWLKQALENDVDF